MKRDKILIMIPASLFFLFMLACNPVSEDVADPLWNSQHNEKPFDSDFFHSADYRFPHGACDEPQCHGSSLTGGNSGAPSCTNCHDEQWTVFETGLHTKKISGHYHSIHVDDALTAADRTTNADWFTNCKTALCHGGAAGGNLNGNVIDPGPNADYRYSCIGCHKGFSGSIPPPLHTKKREGAWHSTGSCAGAACHGTGSGDDYTGGSAASAVAGISGHGPACSQCHDGD